MVKLTNLSLWILLVVFCIVPIANAQNTQFTYQGSLNDTSLPANGNFDFQVDLFQTASGGTALATQTLLNVPVTNGVFRLTLDFGTNFTGGGARRLEISVKPAGGPTYTILTPRQPVLSVPYAMQSINASNAVSADTATLATTANNSLALGGTAANQFVLTTDARMTDPRNPLPNSGNYIQNTINQQSADFNIDGNGSLGGTLTAATVSATGALSGSQVNIGANRVLYASNISQLLAVGIGAGTGTTGSDNSFFGNGAGQLNTTGTSNSFFGKFAGNANTASSNSFFGNESGLGNTSGTRNSYLGSNTGRSNLTGNDNTLVGYLSGFSNSASFNSFFGSRSGDNTTSGSQNSFFGYNSGTANLNGDGNSFFGYNAGTAITTGFLNTALGASANFGSSGLTNATAIGAKSFVTLSNTIVLGAINGVNGAAADTRVGIGTSSPTARLEVNGGGGNALAITNGGIKVTGAGVNTNTVVFTMVKTAANTCGGAGGLQTAINNPFSNGDPSAILFVTVQDAVPRAFSVRYVTAASAPPACPFLADRWSILAGTNAFNDNDQLNVMVIKP